MSAQAGIAPNAVDPDGVLSTSRRLQELDVRFFAESRPAYFEEMLARHFKEASAPWLAAVESLEVIDNAFQLDASVPGSDAAQERCLRRLTQLLPVGDEQGQRGLRAILLKRLTEYLGASKNRQHHNADADVDLCKRIVYLMLPDEASATPAASR
eukprot:TRINITY_DN39717_c0_g1_i1.p2 TRINITY_DN39717_c0_g1~~TRINITY_DN39717_c0_g1_i1.p2  ORF type:complete len:155 (+),score=29.01 TRINITY_DN39717_c0_g1_i1:57-521(+)